MKHLLVEQQQRADKMKNWINYTFNSKTNTPTEKKTQEKMMAARHKRPVLVFSKKQHRLRAIWA